MVAPITYQLQIDTGRTGLFDQTIDDVTAYWINQAQWNNGMGGSYEEVSPPARLTVQLSNRSGVFNLDGFLSAELVTNGDFSAWTAGAPDGWGVANGAGDDGWITQVSQSNLFGEGGTGALNIFATPDTFTRPFIVQDNVFQTDKTYRLSLNITAAQIDSESFSVPQGLLGIDVSNTSFGTIYNLTAVKEHVFIRYLPIVENNPAQAKRLVISGASDPYETNTTIDNVSVREVARYAMINRGMQVRLSATYNGVTSTLFQGRISQIQPSAGNSTDKTISLTVEDAMLELLDAEYAPPLLTAPTADVTLQRMFDDAVIRWPYSGSWWLLGIQGCSELGRTTYLYDHDVTDFETGITTFEYTGDVEDRGEGVSAQGFVRDIVAAEAGGRFWFDTRSNQFKFINRDHDPLNNTVVATYTESHFDSVTPKYGEDIVNDLTITYTSRDIGAAGSVIWSLKSIPFLLKNNTQRKFNARYFDANNEQLHVGARDVVQSAAGIDYTANILSDGSSTNMSERINVSVESSGNSAKVIVSNASGLDVYVTLLQVRGTPVTYIEERYQKIDGDSIAANELYPKVIEVRALDNTSLAAQFGDYTVAKFKDPIFRFETAVFNSLNGVTMMDASVNRLLGDKVTITDTSTNHDRTYVIVGEQHTLTIGGDHPRDVTWILKPAERETFWVLEVAGKSELNQTTRLSF